VAVVEVVGRCGAWGRWGRQFETSQQKHSETGRCVSENVVRQEGRAGQEGGAQEAA